MVTAPVTFDRSTNFRFGHFFSPVQRTFLVQHTSRDQRAKMSETFSNPCGWPKHSSMIKNRDRHQYRPPPTYHRYPYLAVWLWLLLSLTSRTYTYTIREATRKINNYAWNPAQNQLESDDPRITAGATAVRYVLYWNLSIMGERAWHVVKLYSEEPGPCLYRAGLVEATIEPFLELGRIFPKVV